MEQSLSDFKLSQAVVDGPTDVHAEFRPALDGGQDSKVCTQYLLVLGQQQSCL